MFIHISHLCLLGCCVFLCPCEPLSPAVWQTEAWRSSLVFWFSDDEGGSPMLGHRADLTLHVMALRACSPGRPLCPFNRTHSEAEICWHWCRKHGHKNMHPFLKKQVVLLLTKVKGEARPRPFLGKLLEMRWVLSRELGLSVLVQVLFNAFSTGSDCRSLMFCQCSL